MTASQNGWVANDRSVINPDAVATGTNVKFPGGVRKDAPGQLLMEVAGRFHRTVEPLHAPWCWGYAERDIRGGGDVSNHASGTAIDCNAPQHPLGKVGTFNSAQVRTIHGIVAATGHVVRWGGDYTGRKDEMHLEINDGQTMADCALALTALRGPKEQEDDMTPEQDKMLRDIQARLVDVTGDRYTAPYAPDDKDNPTRTLTTLLQSVWNATNISSVAAQPTLDAVTALQAAVAGLANDPSITADTLKTIINEAVAQNVRITGTVDITGDPNQGV